MRWRRNKTSENLLQEFKASSNGDKPELLDKSPTELYAMLLKFNLANNLAWQTLHNFIRFLNKLFRKPIIDVEEVAALEEPILDDRDIEFHALCKFCQAYLGEYTHVFEQYKKCPRCHEAIAEDLPEVNPSPDNMFVLMDPTARIKQLLKAFAAHFDEVSREAREHRFEDGQRDSVYDGSQYRWLRRVIRDPDYLTAVLHVSETPLERIGQSDVWPLYLALNELPPEEQSHRVLCCGLWISQKPVDLHWFLSEFLECVKHLAKTGLSVEIEGQQRRLRVHVVSCVVDSRTHSRLLDSALFELPYFDMDDSFVPDALECISSVASHMFHAYMRLLEPPQVRYVDTKLRALLPPWQSLDWTPRFWENFVLYYSVPIFADLLDRPQLSHWMHFVSGVYLLLKDQPKLHELDRAETHLEQFVSQMRRMYGQRSIGPQVDSLLQLANMAKRWGPLRLLSSWCFQPAKRATLQALRSARRGGNVPDFFNFAKMSCFSVGLEARCLQETSNRVAYRARDLLAEPLRDGYSSSRTGAVYFQAEAIKQPMTGLCLGKNLVAYRKMLKAGYLFEAVDESNFTSCLDKSYALLADNTCVRIYQFVVDLDNEAELVVCKRIELRNFSNDNPDVRIYLLDGDYPIGRTVIYAEDLAKVCDIVHDDNDISNLRTALQRQLFRPRRQVQQQQQQQKVVARQLLCNAAEHVIIRRVATSSGSSCSAAREIDVKMTDTDGDNVLAEALRDQVSSNFSLPFTSKTTTAH
ncbi:unnamed protein product [Trichogramma brassicae]|uniref:Uncharacterized protein n=1 Tax=Trichogramma brassicae TaxID=86971 RepID=A0A6H5I4P5_9HYME|nr:unnamed protein product [Trichogramma brassicae]